MRKGGERGLIDNLHPLQRASGDMIESSQAEPIRDSAAVRGRAESASASLFLTGLHLYSCQGRLIEAEEEEKRERRLECASIHHLFPHFCQPQTFSQVPASVTLTWPLAFA